MATIDMGQIVVGLLCPLFGMEVVPCGGAESPSKNNVEWAEAYLHTKWYLDPSNSLATIHQRHRQIGQTDNGPIA